MCQSEEILPIWSSNTDSDWAPFTPIEVVGGVTDNVVHTALFSDSDATLLTSGSCKIGPGPALHRLGPGIFLHGNLLLASNYAARSRNGYSVCLNTDSFAERGVHFLDLFQKRGIITGCWLRGTD